MILKYKNTQVDLNASNYKEIARELKLSYSILQGILGLRDQILLDNQKVAFYDIETDKTNDFLLGYVNDKRFDSAEELVSELTNYDVVCGFNNFRFDNEILYNHAKQNFELRYEGSFCIKKIRNAVNIDLLPVFFFWKPFLHRHTLNQLAKVLGIKKIYDLSDLENKCKEDVEIMKAFYPYAKDLLNWLEINFKLDPETFSSLYYQNFMKLRRWLLQSFMIQRGIYPKLHRVDDDRKPSFYYYHKKGFFKDVYVWDVSSAYPNTVIKLNLGIWEKGDFAEFERFLLEERKKNKTIESAIKFVANAIIGDFNATDSLLIRKDIMCDVWLNFKKTMENWVKKIGKKNIIFAFTDSIFTHLNDIPQPDGYEARIKYHFDWVVIYNQQRILGLKDDGEFHRTHFNRVLPLRIYDYVDSLVEEKLRENPLEFLKNPKLEINIKEVPDEYLSVMVFKTGDVCKNVEFLEFWDKLKYGLNRLYLGKRGFVFDKQKISESKYKKIIEKYLKLYKFRGGVVEK